MQLDTEDFLQAPRIQQLKEQIASSESESEKRKFLAMLTSEIIKAINSLAMDRNGDTISVDNFDEVTASLRNELARANKPLQALLSELNLTTQQQTKVISDIENRSQKEFKSQYQPVLIKRPKDFVQVDNLHEVPLVEDVAVNNFSELTTYLQQLIDKISALKLDVNVEAPQVTVTPTAVNIPAPVLNSPALDLEPIISSIEDGLKKIRTNNKSNPLAVRLTDGSDWVKQLVKVQQETSKAVTAFAGGSNQVRLLDPNMNVINPSALTIPSAIGNGTKAVTAAGTAVALGGNVACRKVTMTALDTNTGKIYWGGSTVSATSGAYIYAGQTQVIDIDNLSKVYIDSGINGEGVNYSYVV